MPMSFLSALKPSHLSRYREIAMLLIKFGGREVAEQIGILQLLGSAPTQDKVQAEADELARDLEQMGPTFIKLGQVLSSRSDLLPLPYLDSLSRLQDEVEPIDYETVEAVILEDLGGKPEQLFAEFHREPLAAASLGQVHRATTHTGIDVVVKVQRPTARESMKDDLEVLSSIAKLLDEHTDLGAQYHFHSIVRQFRKNLTRELDYTREADNLRTVGHNLSHDSYIVVPRPIEDMVSERVLTMQFINGMKVTELDEDQVAQLNGHLLTQHLFDAYLTQILKDGLFHADPHPGNIMVTPDGKIALLDLGMVGNVGERMQEHLLNLLIAVSEQRADDAAEIAVEIGERTDHFKSHEFRSEIAEVITTYYSARFDRMQIGKLVLEVCSVSGRQGLRIPPEVMLLGKALLNLDQIAGSLSPSFDANAAIKRRSSEFMRHRIFASLSPGRIFANLVEFKDVIEKLPTRVSRVLDAVADNEIKVRVDAIDEDRLISGIEKVANRVTIGLVLAALIIGAAFMMRIDTHYKLFGYPALAIILFILAGGVGIYMVFHAVWTDFWERKKKG